MKVSAKILNGTRLGEKLEKLYSEALVAQRQTVKEATLLIHETAIKSIRSQGFGSFVTRYDPYRVVLASKPGDTPNSDTGRLIQSIQFEIEDKGMVGRVGTNLKYGFYLEFGTKNMAARPWLSPAVDDAAKEIIKIAKENTSNAIKNLGGKK